MPVVATRKIPLLSGAGGLNNTVPPSNLKADEFSRLVNYLTDEGGLVKKRPGKELVQYAPIDPQIFTQDVNTLHLWHFDDLVGAVADDTTAPWTAQNLAETSGGRTCPSVPGIFPIGAPLARQTVPATNGVGFSRFGHFFTSTYTDLGIHGLSTVFFDMWIKINSTMSGQPVTIDLTGGGSNFVYTNSGTHLMATVPQAGFGGPGNEGESRNGLTIYRNWDAVAGAHSSDPYIKFKLRTSGGFVTEITSKFLPMDKWLFVRGSYFQSSGKVRLRINGELHREAITSGTVDDSALGLPGILYIGGTKFAQYAPFFAGLDSGFDGVVEEARIRTNVTEAEEALPPFKNPRGKPMPFAKSDGTQQLIVSASDGLYYTVGDGNWTKMGSGFSSTAYWNAEQYGDILYLSNGVDNPLSWDGTTLRPWGENTAPLTLIEVNTGAGSGLSVGAYRYHITFMFGEKETGLGFGTTGAITLANNHMNIGSIPIGPPNCTGRRIYRTKVNPSVTAKPYLLREIANNTTVLLDTAYVSGGSPDADTGRDGVPDGATASNLNDDPDYAQVSARVANTSIGKPRFFVGNHNRILACGYLDAQYTARWCEIDAPDVWLGTSFVNAKADKGPLIGVAVYYQETHFSKNGNATLVLRGDRVSNWQAFETLHPTVGAVDHWSYVHRVIPGSDTYRLAFMGRDGFYEYAGQDIYKISDRINPTFRSLAQADAARLQWITTTMAQFQAAWLAGGQATTVNIRQPAYEVDGLTQLPGTAQIVDQYAYLPLSQDAAPIVAGNIISKIKLDAEGAFLFATDSDNNLYYTGDNFVTKVALSGVGGATERIVEMVRRGSDDFYFLMTDTAGSGSSSGGGFIYTWDNATAVLATLYNTTPMFYDLDVPMHMNGGTGATVTDLAGRSYGGRVVGIGNTDGVSPNNGFINHAQSVLLTMFQNNSPGGGQSTLNLSDGGSSISSPTPNLRYSSNQTGTTSVAVDVPVSVGFISAACFKSNPGVFASFWDIQSLTIGYTRREFPAWRGGTFRPQAYWDVTNSRLVFLASTAESAQGNRSTYLRTMTLAGVLVNQYTAETVSAWATDGVNILFQSVLKNTSGLFGLAGRLRTSTLAAPSVTALLATMPANILCTRLSYNPQVAVTRLGLAKSFNSGAQQFWTYTASLQAVAVASGTLTTLLSLTANGDSGPFYKEVAVQTTTPFPWHVAVGRLTSVALYSVGVAATAAVVTILKAAASGGATGIFDNLLFVPASGAAGGNLWADRLYFHTSGATMNKLVQLGVVGSWTVIGVFEAAQNNFGVFDAYDSIESDYSGDVDFDFRQAADPVSLAAAAYVPVQPNQKLIGFAPVQAYGQWRTTFTWVSTVAAPATSPTLAFVIVNYFFGRAVTPRVVGQHFDGRSLWSVAVNSLDENNFMVVYQRNNSWTTFEDWAIKGMAIFRNQLFALEFYQLVQLMVGDTDIGNLIKALLRTGYLMQDRRDKLMRTGDANMTSFTNSKFPNQNGALKVTPYKRNTAGPSWGVIIPSTEEPVPVQQKMRPLSGVFDLDAWAREYAMQVETSQETSGNYMPTVSQKEDIHSLLLRIWTSGDRYANPTELAVPE